MLVALRDARFTSRLSLAGAGLSLLILFPLTALGNNLDLAAVLVVTVSAFGLALMSVCLATYGTVRANRWRPRLVYLAAGAFGLLALVFWGVGVILPLSSGCLGVTC